MEKISIPQNEAQLISLAYAILQSAAEYINAGYFKTDIFQLPTYANKILQEINTKEE